jgi:hypothetical protein
MTMALALTLALSGCCISPVEAVTMALMAPAEPVIIALALLKNPVQKKQKYRVRSLVTTELQEPTNNQASVIEQQRS